MLAAIDPRYAIAFFAHNGFIGFAALGAVVLAVTGGEALYADMGHFGAPAGAASPGSSSSCRRWC